jgi:hypothetical protein
MPKASENEIVLQKYERHTIQPIETKTTEQTDPQDHFPSGSICLMLKMIVGNCVTE